MKKIGICGIYGNGPEFSGGQPVKVKMVIKELINVFGENEVQCINTYIWKRNPFRLLSNCYKIFKNCKNIIMMPAHNGIKVFTPLFFLFNTIFNRKIHYIVIGGWLTDYLIKYALLRKMISKFAGVYVETNSMKVNLKSLGMENIYVMNNFKKLTPVEKDKMEIEFTQPFKLCVFSRIVRDKGIEDAINAVVQINSTFHREVYKLDLYGFIDESYKQKFNEIMQGAPSYIKYCGVVESDKSVETLKNYFMQLFPTRFRTEGIPGSIIDSYYSGLPVISSKWDSFNDVIEEGKTGIGFEFLSFEDLKAKLIEIANKPELIAEMKKNCLEKSLQYSPDYVIGKFVQYLQ